MFAHRLIFSRRSVYVTLLDTPQVQLPASAANIAANGMISRKIHAPQIISTSLNNRFCLSFRETNKIKRSHLQRTHELYGWPFSLRSRVDFFLLFCMQSRCRVSVSIIDLNWERTTRQYSQYSTYTESDKRFQKREEAYHVEKKLSFLIAGCTRKLN